MKHTLFTLLLTLFLISSCSKDDPYIPCTGDDCFYGVCKVNGEIWRSNCKKDGIFGCSAADVQYYRYDGTYNIYIYIKNDVGESALKVRARGVREVDEIYPLATLGQVPSFYVDRKTSSLCSTYKIDTTKYNYLLLNEIDTVNFIVGGEFEFTGQDSCGKVVNITDGKFRLNYRF